MIRCFTRTPSTCAWITIRSRIGPLIERCSKAASQQNNAHRPASQPSQRAYGSDRFRDAIERQLGRSLQITAICV